MTERTETQWIAPGIAPGACSACGSLNTGPFVSAPGVPAHVCSYWPTAEQALACARGDLHLQFCADCGFIENTAFDEKTAEYTGAYENSLHFSEFFQGYIADFADQILERHTTDGGVLEIGCGNGEFLELLCEKGGGGGVGFDPAYDPNEPLTKLDGRLKFYRDYYTRQYEDVDARLIVCRQVLEHIPQPAQFLKGLRETVGDREGTATIIEVPNFYYALENLNFWDIVYEHPNYFSPPTLARLFSHSGFDVSGAWETYARQFIAIDASPSTSERGEVPADLKDLSALPALIERFSKEFAKTIARWNEKLAAVKAAGERIVVWGAGARGVTFLNLADSERTIEYVVDINHRKHNQYVVGTGQRVVPPSFLEDYRPDHVIIMNPIYKEEITRDLSNMGLSPQILEG